MEFKFIFMILVLIVCINADKLLIADLNLTDSSSAKEYNSAGFKLYKKKDYLSAIKNFRVAIEKDSNYVLAYYNLACCLSIIYNDEKIDSSDIIFALEKTFDLVPKRSIKARKDSDFDNVRNLSWFKNLMKNNMGQFRIKENKLYFYNNGNKSKRLGELKVRQPIGYLPKGEPICIVSPKFNYVIFVSTLSGEEAITQIYDDKGNKKIVTRVDENSDRFFYFENLIPKSQLIWLNGGDFVIFLAHKGIYTYDYQTEDLKCHNYIFKTDDVFKYYDDNETISDQENPHIDPIVFEYPAKLKKIDNDYIEIIVGTNHGDMPMRPIKISAFY